MVSVETILPNDKKFGFQLICCSWQSKRIPFKCFNWLNNSKGWAFLFCWAGLLTSSIIYGAYGAVISTLEKRFQYASVESAGIASAFAVCNGLANIFIALYGEKTFKPMWVGWGLFTVGISCVIFSLPHFTAPEYIPFAEVISSDLNLCLSNTTQDGCGQTPLKNYWLLFMFSVGLFGIGLAPLNSHGISYVDENVKQVNSSTYIGLFYSMSALGPGVGSFLIGAFLMLYTYPSKNVSIQSSDEAWIGAWWVYHLVVGGLCILISVPIQMFPRSLPGSEDYAASRENAMTYGKSKFGNVKSVLKNPSYMLLTIARTINQGFIYGFGTFAIKYLEFVYGTSSTDASLEYGLIAIVSGVVGLFASGAIITRLKLDTIGIMVLTVIIAVIALPFTAGNLLYCNNKPWQDLFPSQLTNTTLCGAACLCTTDLYEPVCADDGVTYYSPCFAGCKLKLNATHYENCSCVPSSDSYESTVIHGSCSEKFCKYTVPFLIIMFMLFFLSLSHTVPTIQATLRVVGYDQRTPALALQQGFASVLGTTPARLVIGKVFDSTCLVWSTECGRTGSCRNYDRPRLALYAMSVVITLKVLHLLLMSGATFLIYRAKRKLEISLNNAY